MKHKTKSGLKIISNNRKARFNYFFSEFFLNRREINKLIGRINREGFTLIPTKLYFKKGKAKVEIAVAKGKRQYDKRQVKKKRDWNRERARYFRKTS